MSQSVTEECLAHPKFQKLARARARFSFGFCLIIILGYGMYVLGMSYLPDVMAQPVTTGGHITYGIVTALLVIISGMVCAGFFTWWANRKFDVLQAELLKELGHE